MVWLKTSAIGSLSRSNSWLGPDKPCRCRLRRDSGLHPALSECHQPVVPFGAVGEQGLGSRRNRGFASSITFLRCPDDRPGEAATSSIYRGLPPPQALANSVQPSRRALRRSQLRCRAAGKGAMTT